MSWFKRSPKVPKELLKYDRRPVRYTASVDDNGVTTVLGKGGSISILDGELIVHSGGKDVFRCSVFNCEAGELLSHDGVRFTTVDDSGKFHSIIAYFVYYRK